MSRLVGNSVTRFGEIKPIRQNILSLWQYFEGILSIWKNYETSLVFLGCYWANFRYWNSTNIEKYSSHLVTLVRNLLLHYFSSCQ